MKRRSFAAWLAAIVAAVLLPEAEAANRKGSHRVGGRNSKGKGGKYVGGRKK